MAATAAAAAKPKVLVVEDVALNRKIFIRMLDKLGAHCFQAVDGCEAVAQCVHTHFDLILMDCLMPVMDGYEATRAIRSGGGLNQSTRIVAITGASIDGNRERCLEAGMNGFCAKPFTLIQLRELLTNQAA